MRIGVDIRHLTDPQPAGVGGYTRQLLEALFRIDQVNEYVLFASGSKRALARLPVFDFPNVRVVSVPIPNKLINLIVLTRLVTMESLLQQKIDCWFFPNHNFIHTKLPYTIMVHDLSYEIFPEFFTLKSRVRHLLARRIIKGAGSIVCPSTSTKQDLIQLYKIDQDKIHITPLAASSVNDRDAAFAATLPKQFILSLATLEPRKNQISIIEAYETYRDQTHDPIHLVIVGGTGWKAKPIFKAAKGSKYTKQIHFIGYVSEAQKVSLYTSANIFVFPSFYEGFGLSVLEAMTAGCPVITSHTSSLPELVGDAGILIDPYNMNDIAAAMNLLLSSDHLRKDIIEKEHYRANQFSWEETARKTIEVFNTIT